MPTTAVTQGHLKADLLSMSGVLALSAGLQKLSKPSFFVIRRLCFFTLLSQIFQGNSTGSFSPQKDSWSVPKSTLFQQLSGCVFPVKKKTERKKNGSVFGMKRLERFCAFKSPVLQLLAQTPLSSPHPATHLISQLFNPLETEDTTISKSDMSNWKHERL